MTFAALPRTPLRILFLVFDKMDTLDFAGPFEILATPNLFCNTPENPGPFTTPTVTGSTALVTSSQGAIFKPHILITEALETLSNYDILVVPGGRREAVTAHGISGPEFELVKAFSLLPPKGDGTERTMLSVCSGTFLLIGTGVLEGMTATSHHMTLTALQAFADKRGKTQIVPSRFVDGGLTKNGMRVITSGGISSGMDGSLYLLELKMGLEVARIAETALEYKWRRDEGIMQHTT